MILGCTQEQLKAATTLRHLPSLKSLTVHTLLITNAIAQDRKFQQKEVIAWSLCCINMLRILYTYFENHYVAYRETHRQRILKLASTLQYFGF